MIRYAVAFAAALLCASCGTYMLGYVQPQTGKTAEQQSLDTLACKEEARLAIQAGDRQVGQFLMGLTIIGAPVAYQIEKGNQRDAFTSCMTARGYTVRPATD